MEGNICSYSFRSLAVHTPRAFIVLICASIDCSIEFRCQQSERGRYREMEEEGRLRSVRLPVHLLWVCTILTGPNLMHASKTITLNVQGAPLMIRMAFTSNKAVGKAIWDLKYMVDMASKRKLIGILIPHLLQKTAPSSRTCVCILPCHE